jgi:hypothetical protein
MIGHRSTRPTTGWTDRVQIVTGELLDECLAVRNTWAARNQAKRP